MVNDAKKPQDSLSDNKLGLGKRYAAAWSEHNTRVVQRQHTVQIFLATVVALFGFWFSKVESVNMTVAMGQSNDPIESVSTMPEYATVFLLWGTLFISTVSAIFIRMHHNVMRQLFSFMALCEHHAKEEIAQTGGGTNELFYFYDPVTGEVDGFHAIQRWKHRVVLTFTLTIPIFVAYGVPVYFFKIDWLNVFSILICTVASLFVAWQMLGDEKEVKMAITRVTLGCLQADKRLK